uniref:Putative snare protein pep12/vam3/syntaxin 7/syntaxin 17 n=1 Tax=Lutzomyia longipalpis TaxID=7200 RepID=A0A1B0CVA4_LUTLO
MTTYASTNNGREADFQKLAQTIATSIQKILQNVSSMQRMVNQFGTAQDSPELKQQFEFEAYVCRLEQLQGYVILKIQRDRLVDEFTSALTAFQVVQRKTVDLEKNAMRQARSTAIAKPPGSQNSSSSGPFEDNFVTGSRGQTQAQMQEDIDLQALEEQERTIRELEENIVGVNEIYKKLEAMVYEQGHVVDSIEASVEQTSVFVSEGADNLKKASQYQNKLRKKKLFIALILAAILAVIILLIVWRN